MKTLTSTTFYKMKDDLFEEYEIEDLKELIERLRKDVFMTYKLLIDEDELWHEILKKEKFLRREAEKQCVILKSRLEKYEKYKKSYRQKRL